MIELKPLTPDDREQFILDNQEAFNYGALEEFGAGMIILKKMGRSSPGIPLSDLSMAEKPIVSCRMGR